MLRPTKPFTIVLIATILATAAGAPASADGISRVDCTREPKPAECDVDVAVPGEHGRDAATDDDAGRGDPEGAGEYDGCVWERVDPQPEPPTASAKGAWYSRLCTSADGTQGLGTAPLWIADAGPTAATVARSARAKLRLPAPVIRTNPDASRTRVLVTVPVWLWVGDSSWRSRSATASVPGLSVTAIATPKKVVWWPGDGKMVTCGQGTAWTAGTDPAKASPTCGHTYELPGTFTLTATVTWAVTWSGGGRSGTVPDLSTTTRTTVDVAEGPAVNTERR